MKAPYSEADGDGAPPLRSQRVRGATKTGVPKAPPMRPILAEELLEYLDLAGISDPDEPLLPAIESSGGWEDWRTKVFNPARARAAARPGFADLRSATSYQLGRHSFVSLHLAAGRSLTQIANWIGDNVKTVADHYAHLIDEYEDQPAIDIDRELAAAKREAPNALRRGE